MLTFLTTIIELGGLIIISVIICIFLILKLAFQKTAEAMENKRQKLKIEEENRLRKMKIEAKKAQEEKRKSLSKTVFDGNISQDEFNSFVQFIASKYDRIESVDIKTSVITVTVRSISGISDWCFAVDFNDYGQLTGKYYILYSENTDSGIPEAFANRVRRAIISRMQ